MQRLVLLTAVALVTAAQAAPQNEQHNQHRGLEQEQIDCENDEEVIAFDLLLDGHPEETGFAMTCDGVTVWSVKSGSLADRPTEWITKKACAPTSVKHCSFSMDDSKGNGLTGDGWYSLTFGAETVAVYDQSAFSTRTYCFGSTCAEAPLEVSDMQQECKPVVFELGLDSNPSETSVKLVCDNEILWNVKQLNTPFGKVQLEECVAPYACCQLTIHDSGNDGLIAGNANHSGYFALEADYQDKLRYSGEDGMQFSTLTVAFGNENKCSASQIVSQVDTTAENADAADTSSSYGVGAVVGSFFGGVVASALLIGLTVSIWRSRDVSDDARPLSRPPLDDAEDGSKASVGEQPTAWSEAENST